MRTDISGRPGQQAQQSSVSTVAPLAEEEDLMVLGVVQGGVGEPQMLPRARCTTFRESMKQNYPNSLKVSLLLIFPMSAIFSNSKRVLKKISCLASAETSSNFLIPQRYLL